MTKQELIDRIDKLPTDVKALVKKREYYQEIMSRGKLTVDMLSYKEMLIATLDEVNSSTAAWDIVQIDNNDIEKLNAEEIDFLKAYIAMGINHQRNETISEDTRRVFEFAVANLELLGEIMQQANNIIKEIEDGNKPFIEFLIKVSRVKTPNSSSFALGHNAEDLIHFAMVNELESKVAKTCKRNNINYTMTMDVIFSHISIKAAIKQYGENYIVHDWFQLLLNNPTLVKIIENIKKIYTFNNDDNPLVLLIRRLILISDKNDVKSRLDLNDAYNEIIPYLCLGLLHMELEEQQRRKEKINALILELQNDCCTSAIEKDRELQEMLDPETLVATLLLIEANKATAYRKLTQEIDSLREEKANGVDKTLITYNINPKSVLPKVYSALKDIKNLDQMLAIIKEHNISIAEYLNLGLGVALANTNINILTQVFRLVDQRIISLEFISSNFGVLISSTNNNSPLPALYEVLMENYKLFEEFNPNFYKEEGYNAQMLQNSPTMIRNNISILRDYNKSLGGKIITNPSLIVDHRLLSIVDYLLENNINPYSINGINLNNQNTTHIIKRLEIARRIGKAYLSDKGQLLPCIITGENFSATNEEIDDCVYNPVSKAIDTRITKVLEEVVGTRMQEEGLITILDQHFFNTPSLYNINGIMIFRPKVIRGVTVLQSNEETKNEPDAVLLFNTIIDNTFLNSKQIETIKRALKSIGYNPDETIKTRKQESN